MDWNVSRSANVTEATPVMWPDIHFTLKRSNFSLNLQYFRILHLHIF